MDSEFRKAIAESPPTVPREKSLVGKYRPDVETDYATDFIRANRDRPFACRLSFYLPHTPKEAPTEDIALYEDVIQPREQAIYHAMVNRIDWKLILNTSRPPELYRRDSPQPDTENLFGQAHTREKALDLLERLGAWAANTGDEIGARLVGQWAEQFRRI